MDIYHYTSINNLESIKRDGLKSGDEGDWICFSVHPTLYKGAFGDLCIVYNAGFDECVNDDYVYNMQHSDEIIAQIDNGEDVDECDSEVSIARSLIPANELTFIY